MNWKNAMLAVPVAVALAAPAHADDVPGYLDALAQAGVPQGSQSKMIAAGHTICDDLHNGMTPQDVINKELPPIGRISWGPGAVAAAQNHLCPDTLGR